MRAEAIADATCNEFEKQTDFVFVNFANPDMVGHTGDKDAIIRAVETVDTELGKVVACAKEHNVTLVITADHGNAEFIYDDSANVVHTAHTTNPVPCIIIGSTQKFLERGELADIAPTVLSIMGLPKAEKMTGRSLIA